MKKALADALEIRGYTTLTPVQEAVTKPELVGADMLVSAQTGSGKTLGFGLAIAPSLLGEDETFMQAAAPLALVIAPTRELALQVKRELSWLYAQAGAVVTSCVGGMDMRDERRALQRGAHVVVATPGRLRDHIMRGSIDLGDLRAVVLDEADEMLDLGFREDLEFILGEAPETRQTLLFSATVPAAIAKLAKSYQKDAVRVSTTAEKSQHADIEYRAMQVSARDGENAIINVLRYYEAPNTIVFCNTRAMVTRLTTRLSNRGFSVVALSGELSQNERTHALQAMRDGRARVCVATDVAARGIDLPNLDLVVHAELPSNHETLLHRSGRTGRAGRKGVSALIVPPAARKKAERLLSMAKLNAQWADAPSADAVRARDEERMMDDPIWHEEITETERSAVEQLSARFAVDQIAAAYLRLYNDRHSAPEDLSNADERPAPRAAFGPSVWFSIAGGRAQNAEPRRLLPMLCKAGNITRDDIGAIRIQQDESLVEIRESSLAGFLAAIGPDMRVEGGVVLTRVNPSAAGAGARDTRPPAVRAPAAKDTRPRAPIKREARPPAPPARAERAPAPATAAKEPRAAVKPKYQSAKPKAASEAPQGTTSPFQWDDEPIVRPKKPKASVHAAAAKKPKKTGAYRSEAAGTLSVPKRKADGAAPKRSEGAGKPGKGPKPSFGKSAGKPTKAKARPTGKFSKGGSDAGGRGKK